VSREDVLHEAGAVEPRPRRRAAPSVRHTEIALRRRQHSRGGPRWCSRRHALRDADGCQDLRRVPAYVDPDPADGHLRTRPGRAEHDRAQCNGGDRLSRYHVATMYELPEHEPSRRNGLPRNHAVRGGKTAAEVGLARNRFRRAVLVRSRRSTATVSCTLRGTPRRPPPMAAATARVWRR